MTRPKQCKSGENASAASGADRGKSRGHAVARQTRGREPHHLPAAPISLVPRSHKIGKLFFILHGAMGKMFEVLKL